ncbi:unnamed protein product [Anisakis simplex]|uniref:Uncharacterized protein n=1 Tax=Anisakis simplex TaxID=6269 RepID=A0A0M3JD08_ANISI|nr:unnamed protein product [Anisakis simplex]
MRSDLVERIAQIEMNKRKVDARFEQLIATLNANQESNQVKKDAQRELLAQITTDTRNNSKTVAILCS